MPATPVPDQSSFLQRLKAALPLGWFPDATPVLDAVLAGLAASWSTLFQGLSYVQGQTRIATATGFLLDIAAVDFFGRNLRRRTSETDEAFRARMQREFLRDHGTRAALLANVFDATGAAATVLEFARPTDTGAYGIASAYGTAGAWGSLSLPYQALITTQGDAIAAVAATLPVATIAWTQTT